MRTLLLVLLTTSLHSTQAQVMFGNRAGWSLIKQHVGGSGTFPATPPGMFQDLYSDLEFRSGGFAGAATLDITVTDLLLIGAELGYSQRGYLAIEHGRYRQTARTSHVSVSILPKLRLGKGLFRGEVFGGVDLARLLALWGEYEYYHTGIRPMNALGPERYTRKELMAPFQLSLVGGAGLVIGRGPVLLHLNGRYVHGITNIFTTPVTVMDPIGIPYASGSFFDRSLIFSFGYSVALSPGPWRSQPTE